MRLASLASVLARLDILLSIVPCATSVIKEEGHEDASARREHQESGKSLCSEEWASAERSDHSKRDTDSDWGEDGEKTRLDHLVKTGLVDDGNALLVVRFLLVGADSGVFLKLAANFLDHFLSGDSNSFNGPCAENEDSH